MLAGHRTWVFEQKPVIISTGTVGGPFEADGAISEDFDLLHADLWLGQDSYEKVVPFFYIISLVLHKQKINLSSVSD